MSWKRKISPGMVEFISSRETFLSIRHGGRIDRNAGQIFQASFNSFLLCHVTKCKKCNSSNKLSVIIYFFLLVCRGIYINTFQTFQPQQCLESEFHIGRFIPSLQATESFAPTNAGTNRALLSFISPDCFSLPFLS